jgi:uncharacterized membrane protein
MRQMPAEEANDRVQTLGPVHLVVVGLHNENLKGQIAQALQDASANGVIRILDALAVQKTAEGEIKSLGATDLTPEQREVYGALVGALLGLGMTGSEEGAQRGAEMGASAFAERNFGMSQQDIQAIAYDIPLERTLLLVLFEHRWAIPLKEAIMSANGEVFAQGIIRPETLVAVGAELGAAIEAAEEYERITA